MIIGPYINSIAIIVGAIGGSLYRPGSPDAFTKVCH